METKRTKNSSGNLSVCSWAGNGDDDASMRLPDLSDGPTTIPIVAKYATDFESIVRSSRYSGLYFFGRFLYPILFYIKNACSYCSVFCSNGLEKSARVARQTPARHQCYALLALS